MRVTSGWAGGMRLASPRGDRVRPTTDRVREAVFSSLGARVDGARALDLYAGTGSLAIEALSRGAAAAVFVESDPVAIRSLRRNLDELVRRGLPPDAAVVLRRPVDDALNRLSRAGDRFDLVFADPPYADPAAPRIPAAIAAAGILAPGGVLMVEHAVDRPPETVAALPELRHHPYGRTAVSIFADPRPPRSEPEESPR